MNSETKLPEKTTLPLYAGKERSWEDLLTIVSSDKNTTDETKKLAELIAEYPEELPLFFYAMWQGRITDLSKETLGQLIQAGWDINRPIQGSHIAANKEGSFTPLEYVAGCISEGGEVEPLKLLLESGADPNGYYENTPLESLFMDEWIDNINLVNKAFKMLIAKGAVRIVRKERSENLRSFLTATKKKHQGLEVVKFCHEMLNRYGIAP